MTRIQRKCMALVASLALAVGCALVAIGPSSAAPTKAYADTVTVAVPATSMPLKGKSLTSSDVSYMGSKVSSKWYTFTTSNRNSSYRIAISELVQQDFDVILYDTDHRELDRWNTEDRLRRTYTDLDRSSRFLVELRRDTNVTARADYKITFKELVQAPDPVTKLRVKSKKGSHKITVSYTKSTYATGYQIWNQRAFGKNRTPFYKYTKSGSITYKTDFRGKKYPYRVKVRPYRTVNGKRYYGEWSDVVKVVVR